MKNQDAYSLAGYGVDTHPINIVFDSSEEFGNYFANYIINPSKITKSTNNNRILMTTTKENGVIFGEFNIDNIGNFIG